jgi:gp45 sliding clamp, C terminal
MQFDQRTVQLLSNFATISKSLAFKPGRDIATMTKEKTILARAKLGHDIPQEFAIHDLSKLLGVVRLFQEPVVVITPEALVFSEDAREVRYTLAAPVLMGEQPPTKEFVFPVDVTFPFAGAQLKDLKNAAATLSHHEVAVVGDRGQVFVETLNADNPTSDTYRVYVCDTEKPDFKIVLKIDNLRLINTDYQVEVSFKKIVRFKAEDLEYLVAVEAKKSIIP